MIKAEIVSRLINLSNKDLETIARSSGYNDCLFLTAKFVGITNSGSFCYSVSFPGDDKETENGKVYVTYSPTREIFELDF